MDNKKVFSVDCVALFADGTIGISDHVGYVGTLETNEVKELYEAIKKLYESKG